ncbi:MAG TPA: THUMP domain-containing protein, partial [Flavobacteriaceae bacterium]|nr:THUMP domain-containing protein [Flavobacteriaceae bacterium]
MVATTLFGLEEVLAEELKNLGAQDSKIGVRSVTFWGDKGFMYKANLALRTAIRILKPIKTFSVNNEDDLYKEMQCINWENYMDAASTFAIGAVVNSNNFTSNSHYISLKSKDAIADYFRHKYHKRPNVDLKHPDVKIHVHIKNNKCTVSIDSSGNSLHKRGYRSATNIAPINEVLAAGLVLLSGYNGNGNFIDPMCGSGTILIEAAMIACNIPANINRNEFSFEKWPDYDEDLFNTIHDSLLKKITSPAFKIMGFDKAPSAIRKAKENIKNANLDEFVGVHHVNFFNSTKEV